MEKKTKTAFGRKVHEMFNDRRAAGSFEYSLLLSLMTVGAMAGMVNLRNAVDNAFYNIGDIIAALAR